MPGSPIQFILNYNFQNVFIEGPAVQIIVCNDTVNLALTTYIFYQIAFESVIEDGHALFN